ncbi:MAG: hypothetical protein HY720_11915 [Planctomycetes bacterium]|nr:hypothetical protein [Planctomycetota bacterium]
MPIQVTCTCGRTLSIPDEFAGKKIECAMCGAKVPVPAPGAPAGLVAPMPAAPGAPRPAASGPGPAPAPGASISVLCACGQKLTVPAVMAGRSGRCPKCGAAVTIPKGSGDAAAGPPRPGPGAPLAPPPPPGVAPGLPRPELRPLAALTPPTGATFARPGGPPARRFVPASPGMPKPELMASAPDTGMRPCPFCGEPVPADSSRCNHCNEEIVPEGAPSAFCPTCRSDRTVVRGPDGSRRCSSCGSPVAAAGRTGPLGPGALRPGRRGAARFERASATEGARAGIYIVGAFNVLAGLGYLGFFGLAFLGAVAQGALLGGAFALGALGGAAMIASGIFCFMRRAEGMTYSKTAFVLIAIDVLPFACCLAFFASAAPPDMGGQGVAMVAVFTAIALFWPGLQWFLLNKTPMARAFDR